MTKHNSWEYNETVPPTAEQMREKVGQYVETDDGYLKMHLTGIVEMGKCAFYKGLVVTPDGITVREMGRTDIHEITKEKFDEAFYAALKMIRDAHKE